MLRIINVSKDDFQLISRLNFILHLYRHISKEDMFTMVYDEIPHASYDFKKCSLDHLFEWLTECSRVYEIRKEAFNRCWTVVKGGEY